MLETKNEINNITELDLNDNFNLKNSCTCKNCHIENKWLSFNIDNLKVIIGGFTDIPTQIWIKAREYSSFYTGWY